MPYTKFGPKWRKSEGNVLPEFVFENDFDEYTDEDKGISSYSYDEDGFSLLTEKRPTPKNTKTGLRQNLAKMLNNGYEDDNPDSTYRKIENILFQNV